MGQSIAQHDNFLLGKGQSARSSSADSVADDAKANYVAQQKIFLLGKTAND